MQFKLGEKRDIVTIVSRSKYYEIFITQRDPCVEQIHVLCTEVRELILSTLRDVTSPIMESIVGSCQVAFKCPDHPEEDHLCVVDGVEKNPKMFDCHKDDKCKVSVTMGREHRVWFNEASFIFN